MSRGGGQKVLTCIDEAVAGHVLHYTLLGLRAGSRVMPGH